MPIDARFRFEGPIRAILSAVRLMTATPRGRRRFGSVPNASHAVSLMRIVSRSCASACAMARRNRSVGRVSDPRERIASTDLRDTSMTEAGCAFERENVPGIRGTQMAEDKGQAGADLIWRGPGCGYTSKRKRTGELRPFMKRRPRRSGT